MSTDNRELAISMSLDDWWMVICGLSKAGDAYKDHRDALQSIHAIAEDRSINYNATLWPSLIARACVEDLDQVNEASLEMGGQTPSGSDAEHP